MPFPRAEEGQRRGVSSSESDFIGDLRPDKDESIGKLVVHQEFLISQALTEIAVFPITK
jgi:hypothetical protein